MTRRRVFGEEGEVVTHEEGDFNGLACHWLGNGRLRLAVTIGCGPRIVCCTLDGGRNLLAETPDFTLDSPYGPLRLLGGHRLWYGPEIVERTYWPDNDPVKLVRFTDGERYLSGADHFGIVKEMTITLDPSEARVTVSHVLRNTGDGPIELAPWALTMVPLGGVTLLPQPQGPVDPQGLLPNRFMTLWPYSDPTDPRLAWGNRIILIRGQPAPPNKLGYRNVHGWVAHWLDGTLLVKEFPTHLDGTHPDNGCNVECYVNDTFMEVESLGALVTLAPGETATHDEIWTLHGDVAPIADEEAAVALAGSLGLR